MRAIPTLKISISGVRGVIGDSLSPTLLTRFAQAFGTYVGSGGIVIGRDPRTSGEMVKQAVIAGLLSSGCRVVDVGMCPVPTVQMMVRRYGAQGGLAITASHNPAEWNALKFIGPDGLFLGAGSAREMLDIYHQGEYTKVAGAEMRAVEVMSGATDIHIKEILDALGPLPTRPRRLRVVLDACNGAGSIVGPKLLEALGAEVFTINDQPNGQFPPPGRAAAGKSRETSAPPSKRTAPTSDSLRTWTPIGWPSSLSRGRPSAKTTPSYSPRCTCSARSADRSSLIFQLLTHWISWQSALTVPLYRTRIGEANVTERMQREGAVIGGEGNGGVIYPRINFARDSLVGMALILHLIARQERPLSEILSELPRLYMIKEKVICPSHKIGDVLKMIRQVYADAPMDLTDGVKVSLPHGWLHVRGSNTEPIIRLSAEAETEEQVRQITESVFGLIQERVAR